MTAALLASRDLTGWRGGPSPRERALAHYFEGLDHYARGEPQKTFRAMRAAWEADPGFAPALNELYGLYDAARRVSSLRPFLDSISQHAGPTGLCADVLIARHESRSLPVPQSPLEDRCARYAWIMTFYSIDADEYAAVAHALWDEYPHTLLASTVLLAALAIVEQWDSLLGLAKQLTSRETHPLVRAFAYSYEAAALHALGHHDDALVAERKGDAVTNGAPPWVRYHFLSGMRYGNAHGHFPSGKLDTWLQAHVDSVNRAADQALLTLQEGTEGFLAVYLSHNRALWLLDHGYLRESLAEWDNLVRMADSIGDPELQGVAYMRRGRTLVKLGEPEMAERDLLEARNLATRATPLSLAYEVEHNLLHLYEAAERDTEARRAGQAFVDLTNKAGLRPERMMSYRDYGWYLRRRGEHESARKMFEAMVANIDSLNNYHNYAGEYYEFIGDLDKAFTYYRTARQPGGLEFGRTMEALVRIAEATGDTSGAVDYARRHDTQLDRSYPENKPLMPGVLARAGRLEEARVKLLSGREKALRRGQAAGWAKLTLETAAVELQLGNPALAALLADSAANSAAQVAEAETAIRARALGGLARAYVGGPRHEALEQLHGAANEAARIALPQLESDVYVMLGDALSASDSIDAALEAFRRAGDLSDSIAASVAVDPTRAGFRMAQINVSTRSLSAIVARDDDPRASDWYAEWSVRRKSRGILEHMAATGHVHDETGAAILARVRSTLTHDRVIVDYTVLDTAVAALVVTPDDARVVQLPTDAHTLRALVSKLYGHLTPSVGSFIDLSRVSFDRDAARALYSAILEPLEPLLVERPRLTIVPDAPLHFLPFDALVLSGSNSEPVYALDRYTITLASSLKADGKPTHAIGDGAAIAVAAPVVNAALLDSHREIAALADALKGRSVVQLTEDDATEEAVRRKAGSASILHFAAHAHTNRHEPDQSSITLAADGTDDGLLHAYEIRGLDLQAGSLVVLSACESAAGRMLGGEGPLSLGRAFLQAGASDVVATLWPVGAATADIMDSFYQALGRGDSPADALRGAKLSLRGGSHPNPLYWAPFILLSRGA